MIKKALLLVLLSTAVSPVAHAQTTNDPLASLHDETIDLELKDAAVADVFDLLSGIAQVDIELSSCVSGELTLRLQGVTVRTLLTTIADSLHLTYRRSSAGALVVDCTAAGGESQRIDMQVADTPLTDVVERLGEAGNLSVRADSCEPFRVDMHVSHAAPEAVLRAVAAQANAELTMQHGAFVLQCATD